MCFLAMKPFTKLVQNFENLFSKNTFYPCIFIFKFENIGKGGELFSSDLLKTNDEALNY